MSKSAIATSSREELLIIVRKRLSTRRAAIEKEVEFHRTTLDDLLTERIELQTKLKILDEDLRFLMKK